MSNLPEWTFRGGSFRHGYSTDDVPKPWTRRSGKWKRDELVPYGKASPEYRETYFICPECENALNPLEVEYRFECDTCGLTLGWAFGGLHEKDDDERFVPKD